MSSPPFKEIPGPWKTQGDAWWFATSLGLSSPEKLHPSCFYGSDADAGKDFRGGPGMLQLLRYSDTPVGPYDELLVVPGRFEHPQEVAQLTGSKASLRVTRIYVSSLATTYAGRREWNIPKQVARFEFLHPTPDTTRVCVYPSLEGSADQFESEPFFSATLTDSRWCPSFPFDTAYLPMSSLCTQPPLPASEHAEVDGQVATEQWALFNPHFRASISLVKITPALQQQSGEPNCRLADQRHFPDLRPYTWGLKLNSFAATFSAAQKVCSQ